MKKSVALCTYNGARFISTQLESIFFQTEKVDEIIICDDKSKDYTVKIIKEFERNTNIPIRLIVNRKNIGCTKNFEKALSLCSGDIIFLSDQDDIWMPNKVERITNYFTKNLDKDVVFTNATLINEVNVACYRDTLFDVVGMDKVNKDLVDKGFPYEAISTSSRITGATMALRRSYLPFCIPFPNIWAVHDEVIGTIASIYNRIGYIDECLIQYRIHQTQTIGLNALFKCPPKSWAFADNLQSWHENLVHPADETVLLNVRFIYKRYYTIRSWFSIYKILWMYYINKEYDRYGEYSQYFFHRDIYASLTRIWRKIKKLTFCDN